jgi:D-alanyl-D-alanine carboxypeptidase
MSDWLVHAARYCERWIDFQMRAGELPGCVLAISRGQDLLTEAAFGFADLAERSVLTPQHRFRVASHSKTFTAVGIMKLHDAGCLRLDDPVGQYVQDLRADLASVTIEQLLTHTSGLMRDGDDSGHWQDRKPFLNEAELRAQLAAPSTLEADERFKYSNLGFGLLGLVIESVAGEPFTQWIQREIVDAAGLRATQADMPAPVGVPVASGHTGRLPAGRRVIPGLNQTHALVSATGFVSTARDLASFYSMLDPDCAVSLLSRASRKALTRPHWNFRSLGEERSYGLGAMTGATLGHAWFGHTGSFQGFSSRTAVIPEWQCTISILTNSVDGPAKTWIDGAISILDQFSRHGAPDALGAQWTGRWWGVWGALDLVPMGGKVMVASPALSWPFSDTMELTVTSATEGRISLASGMASHGEPVRRAMGDDAMAIRLRLGGTELLPEAAFKDEMERRWSGFAQ